ncbi:MAG: MarR family transcriptional regulator [Aeromicrobium sp.]|nr:MarR family transcriptional regulator [Aeromicrobium sp.]
MRKEDSADVGDIDEEVRALLLLIPRLVGRAKRIPVPDEVRDLELAPRHLSLLSLVLFDGPMSVSELAARLELAPTTVSLLISELADKGIVDRSADSTDARRRIVDIAEDRRPAISAWLGPGAAAWRRALAPLDREQRRMVVDTLRAYEAAHDG